MVYQDGAIWRWCKGGQWVGNIISCWLLSPHTLQEQARKCYGTLQHSKQGKLGHVVRIPIIFQHVKNSSIGRIISKIEMYPLTLWLLEIRSLWQRRKTFNTCLNNNCQLFNCFIRHHQWIQLHQWWSHAISERWFAAAAVTTGIYGANNNKVGIFILDSLFISHWSIVKLLWPHWCRQRL